jgi:hypothetical protein
MQFAGSISVGPTGLYWVNSQGLMTIPAAGVVPTLLAAPGQEPLALGSTGVYFVNIQWSPDGLTSEDAIWTVPLTGGAPALFLPIPRVGMAMEQQHPTSMAADATHLYWTVRGHQGGVWQAPLAGGPPARLFTGYVAGPLAIDATSIYWVTGDLAAQPPWAPFPPSTTIAKMPLSGGTPAVVTSGWDAITAIAVDETSVYWLDAGNPSQGPSGTVDKVPLEGGPPVTLATGQTIGWGTPGNVNWNRYLAVDATGVYWGTEGTQANSYSDGAVMKVPLTGGSPVTIASGGISVGALAIDGESVYWANNYDGYVMKATPK